MERWRAHVVVFDGAVCQEGQVLRLELDLRGTVPRKTSERNGVAADILVLRAAAAQ